MSHVGPNFESKFRPLLLNVKFSDRHQITRKRSNIISKGKTMDRKFRYIGTLRHCSFVVINFLQQYRNYFSRTLP